MGFFSILASVWVLWEPGDKCAGLESSVDMLDELSINTRGNKRES